MIIRLANSKDIPHILQVVEDSYLPFAEQDDKIIGVAVGIEFGPRAYHLKMMFVSAQYQNQKIGEVLLEHFEQRGRERQFSLFTSNYLAWAKWSWKFYEKHGYKEYAPEYENISQDLKDQVAFLKEIGRLNNGDKHLIWKKR